jgi:transmembrane sensor
MQSSATKGIMHENDIKNILARYLAGTATEPEKQLLERFFADNRDEALQEQINPAEYKLLESRLRQKIHFKLTPRLSWSRVMWRVAASITVIAVLAGVYRFAGQKKIEMPPVQTVSLVRTTERGQKITIKLPDGTLVKLNSSSKLIFPDKFTGSAREVTLAGEGYFEVVHNSSLPFIVHTDHSATQVLGTSFNVNAKSSSATEVTLVTGKVKVSGSASNESITLKPSQQAIITQGKNLIDTVSVDVSKFIEWKDNVLTFDDTPLNQVVVRLEEWYGVGITVKSKAIENCRITARYESESLENVMESLEFLLKGNYTLKGKNVTLSGEGCNSTNKPKQ